MNSPTKPPLSWSAGAASEQGRRSENQDRMTRFTSPFGELVVVADGMGGMNGGATAAATVVRMLPELLSQTAPATVAPDALRAAVRKINEEIYRLGNSGDPALAHMGTTLVLALLRDNGDTLVASIGDSRAYLFRAGALSQISKDHSAVQRLVDAGAISAEESRNHPESSVLTRAIGQQPDVQLEIYTAFTLQPGDGLLLCSDGLSGFTSTENITAILRRNAEPAAAVRALGAHALECGSDDNVTIQYLRVNTAKGAVVQPPPRRAQWPLWAGAAAALLIGTAALRFALMQSPVPTLEIRVVNGTSEVAPAKVETAPGKTSKAKPTPVKKAAVIIYLSGPGPAWLARGAKLDCADLRQRDRTERKGHFKDADPAITHVFYRAEAAAAKNCLLKEIPELSGAHVAESSKLPKDAGIVILLPESDSTYH